MMSKKTSGIWQYCTVLDKAHAKCNLCKQKLSYKSSITNIKRHLARKHPDVCQYQVAETIKFKPIDTITSDSEATYEVYNENEQAQSTNDFKLVPSETRCGTFHILPRAVAEDENEDNEEHLSYNMHSFREPRKPKTSDIWQYCTVVDKAFAKCNICDAVLSYRTSITNIKKHLARKHMFAYPVGKNKNPPEKTVIVYENEDDDMSQAKLEPIQTKVEPMEQEPPSFIHTYSRKKDSPYLNVKNRVDRKFLDLFIKDYQAFRIVEDVGFRSFVKALNPSYIIPSKQNIIKSLSSAYGKCMTNMKQQAEEIEECCLTTEWWTSTSNENFLTVTAHFIDEEFTMKSILLECISIHENTNFIVELQRITDEWGISSKILLAISDNTLEIVSAMVELGWNHFGCFAHTINSVVQESMTIVNPLLEKVKSIISYFKGNAEATAKLEIYQRNIDNSAKPKKLLLESATIWHATLRMLERFSELENPIKETSLLYPDTNLLHLDFEEWIVVHELCAILKPFESVTNFISSENYTPASLVIVLTKELDDALQEMLLNEFTPTINEILTKLKTDLLEQLGGVEMNDTLALCTFLDPRFKHLGFSSAAAAESTKGNLIDLITRKTSETTNTTAQSPVKIDANETFSIWQSFKRRVSECKQPGSSKSKAMVEVERYLEDELVDQQTNPLDWWKQFSAMYPNMGTVAREVMCALGTAVPCDRLFSKAGYLLNMRRNSLSEEVKLLSFLNVNSELYSKKGLDL